MKLTIYFYGSAFKAAFIFFLLTIAVNSVNAQCGVAFPYPDITVNQTQFCVGDTLEVTYDYSGCGVCPSREQMAIVWRSSTNMFNWSFHSGWFLNKSVFKIAMDSSGTFKVRGCMRVVGSGSACIESPTTILIQVQTVPDAPSVTNDTVCVNEISSVTATWSGSKTVEWFDTASGTGAPLSTTAIFTNTYIDTGLYNYYAFVSNTFGLNCRSITSGESLVKVLPIDDATINGLNVGISGQNYTYTASYYSGVSYNWDPTGATVIAGGTSTDSFITVQYNTAGSHKLSLSLTSLNGCTSTDAIIILINYNCIGTPPSSNISGPVTGFKNTNLTFTTPSVTGSTFSWTIVGGSPNTGTGTSITTSWTNSGIKIVKVTASKSGCPDSVDNHTIVISSNCSTYGSDFGTNTSLNQNMDGVTITPSSGNSIEFSMYDPNSIVSDYKITQDYSRGGDSSIYWTHSSPNLNSTSTLLFSSSVDNVSFCIRDIDYNFNGTLKTEVIDSVKIIPYEGATPLTLTPSMYSLGADVSYYSPSGYFYNSSTSVLPSSTLGDVCFDLSGYNIDSIQIDFYETGSMTDEIAISNITWCYTTPVPVDWLLFDIERQGEYVELTWATASELNNDYFTVEHSIDNEIYHNLGEVNGSGTSNKINDYRYSHRVAEAGAHYYRIKQTDYDGSSEYSELRAITLTSDIHNITVWPNPTEGEINISFPSSKATSRTLQITNTVGGVVFQKEIDNNKKSLIVKNIKPGIYVVKFGKSTRKLIAF